jgi:DNA-binding phage protein
LKIAQEAELDRAFGSGELYLAIKTFAETLRSQENISELARKTKRYRKALYRALPFHDSMPR